MIARLTGKIIEKSADRVILENMGIGYEVVVPSNALVDINIKDQVTFFIAEHIKEDEYTLFGFMSNQAKDMYYRLISVNGVGPKASLAILSAHQGEKIQEAILGDDISIFNSVSGIGKKTAQRIILELKGKLITHEEKELNQDDQALQALISLGYSSRDAQAALRDIDSSLSTQERIRLGLKGIR